MRTGFLFRACVRNCATRIVEAIYLAILDREADAQGLTQYSVELRDTGDLTGVIRSIMRSEEAWKKCVLAHPDKMVLAAYRGLLHRDPEPDALRQYATELGEHADPAILLGVIDGSQEHWDRLLTNRAEHFVTAVFRGVLNRDPDADALITYAGHLRETSDLSTLISIIARSEEHREQLLETSPPTGQSLQSDNLPSMLSGVVGSQKIWDQLLSIRFPFRGPSSDAYQQDAWVFMHAQKTGGTSLTNMLVETLGDKEVYREHADTLFARSAADLSQYSVFAGHFNYDSICYIPRVTRRLITFLREPSQRLLSLYRFLRAHEPDAPGFESGMEIANRLEIAEFCRSVFATSSSGFWNHLTWCVMGQRKWDAYHTALEGLDNEALPNVLASIRREIRDRLAEFEFIGLQEDFSYSCQRLFELIGARAPHVRHDHSHELLAMNLRHFKYVASYAITPQLTAALAPLVCLDDIVYAEASDRYFLQYNRRGAAEAC